MFLKRHLRLSPFVVAIGVTLLTSPPKMLADDEDAAADAFDRDLGVQRLDPDSGEPVDTTFLPETRGGARGSPAPNKVSSLTDLNEAIRLNPNSASAYNNRNRGKMYLAEGRRQKAASDFAKEAELNSRH